MLRTALTLTLAIGTLAGCGKGDSAQGGVAATPPPAPVVVAVAQRKTVPLTVRAIGNVEPIDSVAIKSRVDGEIVGVHVRDGQDVRKGELLFELDSRYLSAQLRQLEATLARNQALLANAQSTEKRYAELLAQGFISQEAYTQAKANRDAAQATVQADRAAADSARIQLGYTRIRAPISGRAGRVMLPAGNTVKANDTTLVVINQLAPIYVSFAVPERHLAEIRGYYGKGKLDVRAAPQGEPDLIATGRLSFIDNAVDPQTGTIKLRATFDNTRHELWPGQFVTVALTLEQQENALVVPPEAVQNGPRGQYVFVVKPDMTAEVRDVQIDRTEGRDTVVTAGLQEGETVIVSGQLRVSPGARVAPRTG
ncbi:MAG TPA: efflux RND transporter periplasmic adaptor subunit [Burkholderiales bacterium]|jgi:multidrug efflux system membrane fusion protein|nr:efflux RND transporter periplasmic adaptor subunit [Burkholderiales bacterium]